MPGELDGSVMLLKYGVYAVDMAVPNMGCKRLCRLELVVSRAFNPRQKRVTFPLTNRRRLGVCSRDHKQGTDVWKQASEGVK